jgi:hypothetical protein
MTYFYFTRPPIFLVVEAIVQSRVLHYHGVSAHEAHVQSESQSAELSCHHHPCCCHYTCTTSTKDSLVPACSLVLRTRKAEISIWGQYYHSSGSSSSSPARPAFGCSVEGVITELDIRHFDKERLNFIDCVLQRSAGEASRVRHFLASSPICHVEQ